MPPEVVGRIIGERASGESLRTIAAGLNGDRVSTAQGGAKWHASTVKAVLEGQHAIGMAAPVATR